MYSVGFVITLLWGLIKGLYNLNTLLEKQFIKSFDLKDLLNAAGVNELFQSLISKGISSFVSASHFI